MIEGVTSPATMSNISSEGNSPNTKEKLETMLTKYYDSMLKTNRDIFDAFKLIDDLYAAPLDRTSYSTSAYRVEADDDGLNLSIDLPGVKAADLSVQATGREVKVSGKVRGQEFTHYYRVSKEYDPETIDANLEDGVLTLRFNKAASHLPKKVEVKVK